MITQTYPSILIPGDGKRVGSLNEYRGRGGLQGWDKARAMSPAEVIGIVKASALRGRGGAGFPAGIKWESVAGADCPTRYVVCNAAEGEPGTFKDRYLILKNPYQLLEGLLIAGHAVSAKSAVIGIKQKFTEQVRRLRTAIAEFEEAGIIPAGYIEIFEGPDEYLFGEEKALMEAIDGRGALPRIMPPYMLGIRETPTSPNPASVNNVETLSNLPHIFVHGPEWFKEIGRPNSGGTMVFTVIGDVKKPGIYELPMGTSLRELLYEHAGGPAEGRTIKAVFSGAANPVITPDRFDTPLDFDSMKKAGTGLGAGGFIVYDDTACMVQAAAMFARFLGDSSCGQCFPCVSGTNKMAQILERLERGKARSAEIRDILIESGKVTSQNRCYLPAQASNLIPSVLQLFREEFEQHLTHRCAGARQLRLPKISSFDEEHSRFTIE